MDSFVVLADRYAKSTLPDLAQSALPNAPQQPYVERRRLVRTLITRFRRRAGIGVGQRRRATPGCTASPVRSPRTIPGG